ncbi:hypothetical protein [Vibrio caribbeanicus]|uniref:hypothetical protein n=1 Tax=Vibrio caribbeanicus TaxID=701175 RepID=UPI0030DB3810
MSNSLGQYVLEGEVITPCGMNLDISTAVAKADLDRFTQRESEGTTASFVCANIEFLEQTDWFERCGELLLAMLESLFQKLPRSLHTIPVVIGVPESIGAVKLQDWLDETPFASKISYCEVLHDSGARVLKRALTLLDNYDALICISIDSLVYALEKWVEQGKVLSNELPWGIIPSEGSAGLILCRHNTLETLKLTPKSKITYFDLELDTTDRRGMYRLVQRASKHLEHLGAVFSDMTSLRSHTEDYGYVLGAKAKKFTHPQQPLLINELWGTMGRCSLLALMVYAAYYSDIEQPSVLLSFDIDGDKALMQMQNK